MQKLLFSAALLALFTAEASAQGGGYIIRVVPRVGQFGNQQALKPVGPSLGTMYYNQLQRNPVTYPPTAWQPYRAPPGYYRPAPSYPGRWSPSARYY